MRTSLIAFCTAAGVVMLGAVLLKGMPQAPAPLADRYELPEPPKLMELARKVEPEKRPPPPGVPDRPYFHSRMPLSLSA